MTGSQRWLMLSILAAAAVLMYLLAPVLTPFLAGALLAYMGDPLVDRLEERKLPRTGAVTVVFVGLSVLGLAMLLFLVPLLEQQVAALVRRLPSYLAWVQGHAYPALGSLIGGEAGQEPGLDQLKQIIAEQWQQAGGLVVGLVKHLSASGLAVLGWLANLVLIPVVTFYLLRDWDRLVARIRELLPRGVEPTVVSLASECDQVLASFLRGQLLVMLSLGLIYSVGLWLTGLELALLIGLTAGLLSFVPYLGFILGIGAAAAAVVVQFHDWLHVGYVFAVFGVGQTLEGTVLTPRLVGDRIGLHPVAVIFAVLAGGQLFGFFGVLLALPVAAVAMVLLREFHRRYVGSRLYSS